MASSSSVTLDDLETPPTTTTAVDDHLFYPSIEDQEPIPEGSKSPVEEQSRQVLKDRLYIGNLHPTVDEYTLLQIFSKFGKVTKLDYLFHKSGALKGKPRGYAFLEYGNKDDALKALTMAHEKPLRGRKLVVTFAHQAPLDQYGGIGVPSSLKNRKTMMDTGRPTTLSMIKTGMSNRNEGRTLDKIAMMEAKLRQMESTNPVSKPKIPTTNSGDVEMDETSTTTQPPTSSLPFHPSLPVKPPPPLPKHISIEPSLTSNSRPDSKSKASLPPLPMLPSSLQAKSIHPQDPKLVGTKLVQKALSTPSPSTNSQHRTGKPLKLLGVKIKAKEKDSPKI